MKQNNKLKDLGIRVYTDKMTIEKDKQGVEINKDEMEITDICNKTFGKGSPSPENLYLFNQLLVETATEISQPAVNQILGYLAEYDNVAPGTVKIYEMPKTVKPKFLYTAKGTGVDLIRIDGEVTRKLAQPESLTYGAYYEITSFMADPVKAFKNAVDKLAQARVDFFFEKIMEMTKTAVANSEIPANNVKPGSNLTIAEYKEVENTMIRLTGGRPLFFADLAMINHFTDLIPTEQKDLLTDDVRDMIREELIPSKISKSIAIPFENGWIDEANSKVRFDVQTGFVFPGGNSGKKPFMVTEYGVKRQYSEVDSETERVKLKIVFEADITLLNARYLGVVTDDSIIV